MQRRRRMKQLGRPRKSPFDLLPAGVRKIGERFYWQPTSSKEKAARIAAGLPVSIALGDDPDAMRKAWGKLTQDKTVAYDKGGTVAEIMLRFALEELPRIKKKTGKPLFAPKTQRSYRASIKNILEKFGSREYAANQVEASKGGKLRAMDIQQWVNAAMHGESQANRDLSVFSRAFRYAKQCGLTEYNPCLGIQRQEETPRQRDVEPWEIQVLLTACDPIKPEAIARRAPNEPNRIVSCACGCGERFKLYDDIAKRLSNRSRPRLFVRGHGSKRGFWNMGLMIRFADLTGASAQDCRALRREHLRADGVAITRGKTGTRRLSEWTPALRELIAEALAMGPDVRGAVFCNRSGKPYSETAFAQLWSGALAFARRLAKDAGLPELDDPCGLHFHDIRKKAGNDARQQGQAMGEFLGNSEQTARKHYLTRPTKVKPTS